MRLCRLAKRKVIISLILVIGSLLILRQILLEERKVTLTREILLALGSRNTSAQVRQNVNTTVINTRRCKPDPNQGTLLAVIVVISKPDETDDRNNLRAHWRRWKGGLKNLRLIFFVGLPKDNNFSAIQAESAEHDDIIMEAMQESYYSLTLKTLRMLKWFLLSCTNIKYVVKTDMDTFIHYPNLIAYLNSVDDRGPTFATRFIGGDIAIRAPPIVDPSNKWYMPPELLDSMQIKAGDPYPDYALGGFYVISSALVPALFSKSLTVPLIQFEDVFLTGLVANQGLGFNLTRIPYVYSSYKAFFSYIFPSYYNESIIACHLQGDMDVMNNYNEYYQTKHAESLKILTPGTGIGTRRQPFML